MAESESKEPAESKEPDKSKKPADSKKPGNFEKKCAICVKESRTQIITGSVNCLLFLSAGTLFALGVLVGIMPRIRKVKTNESVDLLPQLSPVAFNAVILIALFAVLTSMFGLLGVCCAKNAPNCSRCCMCINLVMALIVTVAVALVSVVAVFFTVTSQKPGCPFGNFTDDDVQPDLAECPYDSTTWVLMQPSSTAYSNWDSVQNMLECCGYYCGDFVTKINGTRTPVCTDDSATKWQRTGIKCAEKPMVSPPCRDAIVEFFEEQMFSFAVASCGFGLLLVVLVVSSFIMRCSITMDNDRPTLRMELPSIRELVPMHKKRSKTKGKKKDKSKKKNKKKNKPADTVEAGDGYI